MTVLKRMVVALLEPWKIVVHPKLRCISRYLPDQFYIRCLYHSCVGKKLNLKDPKSFNEKLQWLKLHDRKPIYTTMVDKYAVKDYVASVIGEEHIIPTLGVWDRFDDIDFEKLPNQFVLKCTHDSAGLVICKDKTTFCVEKAKEKIELCLKRNYFYSGREWPYKHVKPRIIAEQYMEDKNLQELRDYKFFCFNGIVKCFKVDFDRFVEHHANYYDREKNLLRFGEIECPPKFSEVIDIPNNVDQMIDFAEKLSNGIPFLRADFYNVDESIYFGELTFYPASGFGPFTPEEFDLIMGRWLSLPERAGGGISL